MNIFKTTINKKKKSKQTTTHHIQLYEKQYTFYLTRKNIKHTYIKIKPSGLFVITNFDTAYKQIDILLRKYKDQIIKKLNNFDIERPHITLKEDELLFLGDVYKIKKQRLNNTEVLIQNKVVIFNQKDNDLKKHHIENFLRQQALRVFNERLSVMHKEFVKYNVKKPSLKIRKMKSRYGTCYYNDNKIILNMHLIHCHIDWIDYVIAHELCHFLYHDHGKGFQSLLTTIIPDWRDKKIQLNKYFSRLLS